MEASASKEKFKEIYYQEDIARRVVNGEISTLNRATPAASVDNIVTEDDPGLKDDGVDKTTGVESDFFSQTIRLTD